MVLGQKHGTNYLPYTIEEWIGRGMQESAKTMAALLATNGMK